jgi:hypothetical protein
MVQDAKIEVAALRRMSPAELREKYLAVFGEPTRTGNKDFLCKRLAWRLQSMAAGSLSDRARQRAAELARDADIRTTMSRPPTPTAGATQRIQAAPAANSERLPPPGAVLARQYRGRLIEVTVLPKEVEWDGRVFRSLSVVAQAVTGCRTSTIGMVRSGCREVGGAGKRKRPIGIFTTVLCRKSSISWRLSIGHFEWFSTIRVQAAAVDGFSRRFCSPAPLGIVSEPRNFDKRVDSTNT